MTALNEVLYDRLKEVFGGVKISNKGQAFDGYSRPGYTPAVDGQVQGDGQVLSRGGDYMVIKQDGEYYRVCCPFCNDTTFRLYINHRYGTKDKESGRSLDFMTICYNESCMGKGDNRKTLRDMLYSPTLKLARATIRVGKVVDLSKLKARLPGVVTPLHELDKGHPAYSYIKGRKLDPVVLSKFYGVGYCEESVHYLARKRIIVPMRNRGKLVGWQARYCGELDWKGPNKRNLPPKYFTEPNMPKSAFLANLDNAREFHTGVLVEGWFDVFAFGPMAMPLLGKTLSSQQQRDFVAVFKKRAGVVLLDPEEFDTVATKDLVRKLKARMEHVAVVKLPPNTDPGSLDRDFLREYVIAEAEDQGVEVSFAKVPTNGN